MDRLYRHRDCPGRVLSELSVLNQVRLQVHSLLYYIKTEQEAESSCGRLEKESSRSHIDVRINKNNRKPQEGCVWMSAGEFVFPKQSFVSERFIRQRVQQHYSTASTSWIRELTGWTHTDPTASGTSNNVLEQSLTVPRHWPCVYYCYHDKWRSDTPAKGCLLYESYLRVRTYYTYGLLDWRTTCNFVRPANIRKHIYRRIQKILSWPSNHPEFNPASFTTKTRVCGLGSFSHNTHFPSQNLK